MTESMEAAIRAFLTDGIDLAAVATLLRCKFSEVQSVKATLDAESLVETRRKSALAMYVISPKVEQKRADKERGKALKKMASGDCKHASRVAYVPHYVHSTRVLPRGHDFEIPEE